MMQDIYRTHSTIALKASLIVYFVRLLD